MPWKHDVFLLFSCSTKTLVYSLFSWTFFYSFSRARERCIFQAFSHRVNNGECNENMMFVDSFPAPRKRQCTTCFPDRFSIVFPSARTLHFPSVFTQNHEQWRPWKHVARPMFSCSMETAVNSLYCLPECFSVVFVSVRALNSPSVFTHNY